jgi:hypothetical protein
MKQYCCLALLARCCSKVEQDLSCLPRHH